MAYTVASRLRIDFEFHSEMAGRNRALTAHSTPWRRTCVRGVQLTDHLIDDAEQFLPVAHVRHQRLVLGFRRVPVFSVHLGIVEAVLHGAPGITEPPGPS